MIIFNRRGASSFAKASEDREDAELTKKKAPQAFIKRKVRKVAQSIFALLAKGSVKLCATLRTLRFNILMRCARFFYAYAPLRFSKL